MSGTALHDILMLVLEYFNFEASLFILIVVVVLGTKGRVVIHSPGHCPTKISVTFKEQGRGNASATKVYEYPLPGDEDGYFYPNSAGFAYEAAAVARCIHAGLTEAPQFSLQETLNNAKILDTCRAQIGVKNFDS